MPGSPRSTVSTDARFLPSMTDSQFRWTPGSAVHRADARKCPPTDAHTLHNNWQRHGGVLTCIYCADTIYLRSARSPNIDHSRLAILIALLRMHFIDILSLTLSFLGIYGLIISLRYLIPCYIIPFLSAHLDSTQQLLNHAEAINAIPPESEYRTHLDLYGNLYVDCPSHSYISIQFGEQIRGDACGE